jgi:hypothetical protein
MRNDSKVKTRKGQLIHTFGVGAMQTNKDGVAMITCGLDHWFEAESIPPMLDKSSIQKFERVDERLQKKLGVKSFRLPPDFKIVEDGIVKRVPIPAKKFPLWHVCSNLSCQMLLRGLKEENDDKPKKCECGAPAYQSRFVTTCPDGHLDDFPWFAWLNSQTGGECIEGKCKLKLAGTGSSSVADIKVKCTVCNTRGVSLRGIFQSENDPETGHLVSTLSNAGISCKSNSPWIAEKKENSCNKAMVAVLRQSTNVYFSKTDSSIYLPLDSQASLEDIADSFAELTDLQKAKVNGNDDLNYKVDLLSMIFNGQYTENKIRQYLKSLEQNDDDNAQSEDEYRFQERKFFLKNVSERTLSVKPQDLNIYNDWISDYFKYIALVDKLTVTQAMYGFDRLTPSTSKSVDDYKKMLWKDERNISEWLPAAQSHGEGIYIEFDDKKIEEWSKEYGASSSFANLVRNKEQNTYLDNIETLTPALMLVHSFSHLLMNRLVYESGYSSAALRERLYVSDKDDKKMYGVLIYTASGDTEGSLGGLVRIGKSGKLEQIIKKAVLDAQWCSSDPICFESGDNGGQGPNGLNLAACHNCLLLPETSCELFNTFLDRVAVNGDISPLRGFFDGLNE